MIGHRGDPTRFPQNSIAGILAAGDHASMAEIDVRPAADGTLVLSHDPWVGGVTLVEHPWDALSAIEIGSGHRLGRFDELVAHAGAFPLNIEIKNWPDDPDFDPQFGFAMEAARLARPIDLVTCFHWPTVHAIKAEFPDIPTGLLVDAGSDTAEATEAARANGHQALALHGSLLAGDPEASVVTASDLAIYAWTVNDLEYGLRLADARVAGVITDDPAAMSAAFQGA